MAQGTGLLSIAGHPEGRVREGHFRLKLKEIGGGTLQHPTQIFQVFQPYHRGGVVLELMHRIAMHSQRFRQLLVGHLALGH
jgi:hypothetical protein